MRGSGAADLPPRPTRSWGKIFRKHLASSLKQHEDDLWYLETWRIAGTWPAEQDLAYVKADRWADFLQLSPLSPYLKYQVGEKSESQTNLRNLFDMLNADFLDQKNPIAALISGFLTMFMKQYAASLAQDTDAEAAYGDLVKVSTLVLKFVVVLVTTASAFYTNVAIILQQRRQDLEGLLLALIVRADLYRLVTSLALCVQAKAISSLAEVLACPPLPDSLGIEKKSITPSMDRALLEMKNLLGAFITTENLHSRRGICLSLWECLLKWPEDRRPAAAALAVIQTGMETLPGHLYLSRLLLTDSPEGLETFMQAVTSVTSSQV